MRSLRYLNAVLTLVAVLLGLHLWTTWTSGPAFDARAWTVAEAQAAEQPVGLPNASAQRKEMIDLLKKQNQKLDELVALFKTGKAKVKVDMPKD